jgi:hypothetical protein
MAHAMLVAKGDASPTSMPTLYGVCVAKCPVFAEVTCNYDFDVQYQLKKQALGEDAYNAELSRCLKWFKGNCYGGFCSPLKSMPSPVFGECKDVGKRCFENMFEQKNFYKVRRRRERERERE